MLAGAVGFAAYVGLDLGGGAVSLPPMTPLSTPVPTATATPSPSPTPFVKKGGPRKDRPFNNQGKKKMFQGDLSMNARGGQEGQQTGQAMKTPTPTPTPKATATPTLGDRDRFAVAYRTYLIEEPGVAVSLQTIQDEGGRSISGISPQMRRIAMGQALDALIVKAQRNPNDLMINFIVGCVLENAKDNSKATPFLRKAVSADQKSKNPFHLTMENILKIMNARPGGKARR